MSESLLALASAANEAAIAYREAVDADEASGETFATFLAAETLLPAVDALTSAVVEAENNAPTQNTDAALRLLTDCSGEVDE